VVFATGTPWPTDAVPPTLTAPGGEAMSAPSAGAEMPTSIEVPPGRLVLLVCAIAGAAAMSAPASARLATAGRRPPLDASRYIRHPPA
jgi:hypothetical protein